MKGIREFWVAWTDHDGGYIASLYGTRATREEIVEVIKREADEGNPRASTLRPARVLVHTVDTGSEHG